MVTTATPRPSLPSVRTPHGRRRFLIPAALLALVALVLVGVLTAAPRTPAALLGASAPVDGGVARIQGVIPTEEDGWTPPGPAPALATPAGEGAHRVRILVELTALGAEGLSYDPAEYAVSALGNSSWAPVWVSPEPVMLRQGETEDAVLVFELPDRAIDLTLEMPGGPGLSLGTGHHRGD